MATQGVRGQPAFRKTDFPTLGSASTGASTAEAAPAAPHAGGGAGGGDTGAFGLGGLLAATKGVATTDLTALGLNLNSPDPLHGSFGLAWADSPVVPEAAWVTPDCYKLTPPPLRTGHFAKFDAATLMYIFYCLPRDTLQLYAAHELYARGWHFHTLLRTWFTPVADPESGQYYAFNLNVWEKQVFTSDLPDLASGFLPKSELAALPAPAPEGGAAAGAAK